MQILKEIYIRAQKRHHQFTTTYPGFECLVIDKSSFLFMYDEIFRKEIYSFPAPESATIIDCGANIGLATVYFKKKFPQANVLAFEPDPEIFTILTQNIKAAHCTEGTTLIQACLSDSVGETTFYRDGADGGTSVTSTTNTEQVTVPTVRLRDYITQPVDFLKIDIEGSEYTVLKDSLDVLPLVKNIFVEYHSFSNEEQNFDLILKILRDAGFRYYIEHIGVRSPRPYFSRTTDHNMDLQVNIYGYRA
jgi:FkbM family methyltransferase